MSLLKETQQIQEALGKYCQTGERQNIKGALPHRLPHYRRLVYNVVLETLESAFPLSQKLLGEETFEQLCHDFFSNHDCSSHQVFNMPGEFASYYLSQKDLPLYKDFPFLSDLFTFEWKEMEMYLMEDQPIPPSKKNGDALNEVMVLNPEIEILEFSFPVHTKPAGKITLSDKGQYFCLAYRKHTTGQIIFVDISPTMAVILSEIFSGNSLNDIFNQLSQQNLVFTDDQKSMILNFLKNQKELCLGFMSI